jgi:hypothetical protein
MRYVVAFARFWWNFIVGDDWRVAVAVVAALAATALLSHHDVAAWWLMPIAVVVALAVSLRRATADAHTQ